MHSADSRAGPPGPETHPVIFYRWNLGFTHFTSCCWHAVVHGKMIYEQVLTQLQSRPHLEESSFQTRWDKYKPPFLSHTDAAINPRQSARRKQPRTLKSKQQQAYWGRRSYLKFLPFRLCVTWSGLRRCAEVAVRTGGVQKRSPVLSVGQVGLRVALSLLISPLCSLLSQTIMSQG